jgi:hypothetical protein
LSGEKLNLKQILGCIDYNYKGAWKEFTDDEKKSVNFWLLNRYTSSVKGSRQTQERAVLLTNKRYNKHFNDLGVSRETGHPELLWQLLCASGGTEKVEYHEWIGFKKKSDLNPKAVKLISQIYPHLKDDEVELLVRISTKKELGKLAEEYGIEGIKL